MSERLPSERTTLSYIYRPIDGFLGLVAQIGAVALVALVVITMYDVLTRYFGIPKFAGLNSTMVQESEYWAHTILFSTAIAYGLTRQTHVRIDLIRDLMPRRMKYLMEVIGLFLFLGPFAVIGTIYCYSYAMKSFVDNEISPSTIGLTNIWILKSFLVVMFVLLLLAAVSQLLKSMDGLLGNLSEEEEARVLGGGH